MIVIVMCSVFLKIFLIFDISILKLLKKYFFKIKNQKLPQTPTQLIAYTICRNGQKNLYESSCSARFYCGECILKNIHQILQTTKVANNYALEVMQERTVSPTSSFTMQISQGFNQLDFKLPPQKYFQVMISFE